jgi:hypothetical protein
MDPLRVSHATPIGSLHLIIHILLQNQIILVFVQVTERLFKTHLSSVLPLQQKQIVYVHWEQQKKIQRVNHVKMENMDHITDNVENALWVRIQTSMVHWHVLHVKWANGKIKPDKLHVMIVYLLIFMNQIGGTRF